MQASFKELKGVESLLPRYSHHDSHASMHLFRDTLDKIIRFEIGHIFPPWKIERIVKLDLRNTCFPFACHISRSL